MPGVLSLCALIGCSDNRPQRFPVSGKVLIDGEPLRFGRIMVMPSGARASQGLLDSEGRFSLMAYEPGDGVVPGTHPVTVSGAESLSDDRVRWHAPKLYADPKTSKLSITIDQARDDLVIELSWNGGKPFVDGR